MSMRLDIMTAETEKAGKNSEMLKAESKRTTGKRQKKSRQYSGIYRKLDKKGRLRGSR